MYVLFYKRKDSNKWECLPSTFKNKLDVETRRTKLLLTGQYKVVAYGWVETP